MKSKKGKKQENMHDDIGFFFNLYQKNGTIFFSYAHSQKSSSKETFNEHPYRSTAHILSSTRNTNSKRPKNLSYGSVHISSVAGFFFTTLPHPLSKNET